MMAHAVRNPQRFDVIVTTNMFGDILSDLTAELSGSLGLGGSLNAGADHAMAQASHGTAPDIAGKNVANPFSLILSVALLLGWHGRRKKLKGFEAAAAAIEQAVEEAVGARRSNRRRRRQARHRARQARRSPRVCVARRMRCDSHIHIIGALAQLSAAQGAQLSRRRRRARHVAPPRRGA